MVSIIIMSYKQKLYGLYGNHIYLNSLGFLDLVAHYLKREN